MADDTPTSTFAFTFGASGDVRAAASAVPRPERSLSHSRPARTRPLNTHRASPIVKNTTLLSFWEKNNTSSEVFPIVLATKDDKQVRVSKEMALRHMTAHAPVIEELPAGPMQLDADYKVVLALVRSWYSTCFSPLDVLPLLPSLPDLVRLIDLLEDYDSARRLEENFLADFWMRREYGAAGDDSSEVSGLFDAIAGTNLFSEDLAVQVFSRMALSRQLAVLKQWKDELCSWGPSAKKSLMLSVRGRCSDTKEFVDSIEEQLTKLEPFEDAIVNALAGAEDINFDLVDAVADGLFKKQENIEFLFWRHFKKSRQYDLQCHGPPRTPDYTRLKPEHKLLFWEAFTRAAGHTLLPGLFSAIGRRLPPIA